MRLVNTSLNKLLLDKKVTFLIGAGCSVDKPSCLPSGKKMMEAIIEYSCHQDFKVDIENLINEKELRFEQLVEIFIELLDKNLSCIHFFSECKYPNSIHFFLARMIKNGHFVITTNFDSLIEYALIEIGIPRSLILPVITKEEFQLYDNPYDLFKKDKLSIYKIHGSPSDIIKNTSKTELEESLIVTTQSFVKDKSGLNIFELEPYKQKAIENLLNNRVLVVMGYSGSDDFDIIPTLESLDGINEIIWTSHSNSNNTKICEIEHDFAKKSHQDVDKILNKLKKSKKGIKIFKIEGRTKKIISELDLFEEIDVTYNFDLNPIQWFRERIKYPSEIEKIQMCYLIYMKLNHFGKALVCTEKILELSKIEKNPYWESVGYNNKGSIYEVQGKLKDAITYIDKAYEVIKNNPTLSEHLATIYFNKGKALKGQGKLKKSHEIELKALQIAINLKDKMMIAQIQNSLGMIARTLGNNDDAEEYFRSALSLFEEENRPIGKSVVLLNLSLNYRYKGQYKEEYDYLRIATQITENLNSKYYLSACYFELGNYFMNRDDFESALEYYNKTYDIASDLMDIRRQAEILESIGNLYSKQGDLNKALEKYEASFQINNDHEFIPGKAINLEDMGYIFEKKGDLNSAINYYNQALELNKKMGNYKNIMNNYNSLGLAYQKSGKPKIALTFYKESQEMLELVDDPTVLCVFYINMSSVLIDLNDYDKAVENLKLAENICNRLPSKSSLIQLNSNYGKIRKKKGDIKKAIFFYKKSLRFAKECKSKREEAIYLYKIGQLYKKIKNLDKALINYQDAFSITKILNDHYGMSSILYNTGYIKNKKGDFPQALNDLLGAKNIMEKFKVKDIKLYNRIEKAINIVKRNISGA